VQPVTLRAGRASLVVDPADGGRWTSLVVDGLELLSGTCVPGVAARFSSGCFAMAPWAGRLHEGRLRWQGRTAELPRDAPPHAIHGTVVGQATRGRTPGRCDRSSSCTTAASTHAWC
jgi:aldose 1-epimerase